ncbi:MAG: class I SAM-dependent methyltransferase [Mesorhizobium sp.]|nr:class I SAM-dependent methyltransferase [Mesorhizobium sp.]
MNDIEHEFKERLRDTSRTFRKKEGRHTLKSENVIYCAFGTDRFTVGRNEAQRSAPERLARFGLSRANVEGRSALDLGCHNGAMLMELTNLGPSHGLGIEYDAEKVAIAREIATYCGLNQLHFEQGDLDLLDAAALGTFDVVFALAIEAHVLDAGRLYALLGKVTGDILCFEGNGNCDVDAVKESLQAVGFQTIHYIGFCDDDIVPANNKRPMLVARKAEPALI